MCALKELERNTQDQLSKKSIVKELNEVIKEDGNEGMDITQNIELKLRELRNTNRNGITDSIKECLENKGNETYRKIFKELTKSH